LNQPVVDYLVAHAGLPAPRGQAYDYVLAGDGLFVAAENQWLQLRVPIAKCTVRGLSNIYSLCTLVQSRLPVELWFDILTVLRLAHNTGHEVFVGVCHDSTRYRLLLPQQVVTPVSVSYPPQDNLVLELHSHGDADTHFSATDTADEQRLRSPQSYRPLFRSTGVGEESEALDRVGDRRLMLHDVLHVSQSSPRSIGCG
jgi:hypothetical protein